MCGVSDWTVLRDINIAQTIRSILSFGLLFYNDFFNSTLIVFKIISYPEKPLAGASPNSLIRIQWLSPLIHRADRSENPATLPLQRFWGLIRQQKERCDPQAE